MTITLTDKKKVKIQSFASQLLKEGVCSVHTLAKFIGQAEASFHGVMYGPLWYRALEKDKMQGLRQGNGVYDSLVLLSEEAKTELQWWKDNILSSHSLIDISQGNQILYSFRTHLLLVGDVPVKNKSAPQTPEKVFQFHRNQQRPLSPYSGSLYHL